MASRKKLGSFTVVDKLGRERVYDNRDDAESFVSHPNGAGLERRIVENAAPEQIDEAPSEEPVPEENV